MLTATAPTSSTIRAQTEAMCHDLAGAGEDLDAWWDALRATDLPFLPILLRDDPEAAHRLCGNVLREIGRIRLGAAYAFENHLYVLGALETYHALHPTASVRACLDAVLSDRSFLANTHGYVHSDSAFREGVVARPEGEGFVVAGRSHFVSLTGQADLLYLTLVDSPDPTALMIPIRRRPGISFGDELYFPDVLQESDTRSILFDELAVAEDHVLDIPRGHLLPCGAMSVMQMGWHLSLAASAFLGGASRIADETLRFVRQFEVFDGRPMARLDDVTVSLGKIGMRFGVADAVLDACSATIANMAAKGSDAKVLQDGLVQAQIANCEVTDLAEQVSHRCRQLLGTRLFSAEYAALSKMSLELLVGPLAPRNNRILEKDLGNSILAGDGFGAVRWRS